MTPRQVQLVQHTWSRIAPSADHASERFYQRLFQIDPQLRKMFKTDLAEQRRKLMETLHVAVNGLICFEVLVPEIEELGRRHLVQHGVAEEHYESVRKALLEMLATELGDAFTPEVEEAWTATYNKLADVMKSAAYAPAL